MFTSRKFLIFCLILVFGFISLKCAPGDDRWDQDMNPGHRAGFWAGIWHGFIIIITFIISLFNSAVGIYEGNNAGWSYDLGFLIGLCFSILAPWRIKHFGKKHHKKKCA